MTVRVVLETRERLVGSIPGLPKPIGGEERLCVEGDPSDIEVREPSSRSMKKSLGKFKSRDNELPWSHEWRWGMGNGPSS